MPEQENMVDGAFLQSRIRVQWLVQHVSCEQVHCHARVAVPWSLTSALLFNGNMKFVKQVSVVNPYNCQLVRHIAN